LTRAEKLGKRAASAGFDWTDAAGPRAAVTSELAELDGALVNGESVEFVAAELGDVLFSLVNLARHIGVDPEEALRSSNRKFTERFQALEHSMSASGRKVSDGTPAELDELWRKAKETLR
jgi:uncharacterized protein YabN with tetrapyrrole methylase and pyrophosphatase domain